MPTFLGTAGSGNTGGVSLSFSVTYSAGDAVIVWISTGLDPVANINCSDGTNTYTNLTRYDGAVGNILVFKCDSATAGTYTLTIDGSGLSGAGLEVTALRYSDMASGAPQVIATNNYDPGGAGGSDNVVGTSPVATAAGTLIAGAIKQNITATLNAGTGFASRYAGTTQLYATVEDRAVTGAGSQSVTFTTDDGFETFSIVSMVFSGTATGQATRSMHQHRLRRI